MNQFPFGIDFVLGVDCPDTKRYKSNRSSQADYDCPFCHHKRKFHVDHAKGVYRCNACGESGGMLKLHQSLRGLPDTKVAYADLLRIWNSTSEEDKKSTYAVKYSASDATETKATIIDVRDKVYKNLLGYLSLSEEHKNDLLRRGLSEEQIVKGNYKSLPAVGFCTLAEISLWKSVNIPDFQDAMKYWQAVFKNGSVIPGMYRVNDSIRIVRRSNKSISGYFVPVKDCYGRISGMQIRYDNLPENATEKQIENYHKYAWYSSSEKETGCPVTGIENVHHTFTVDGAAPKTVYLTEGCLKADIASAISGKPFIALIGVNNVSQLPQELKYLKENGTQLIKVAVDMDYRDKPNVAKALANIMQIIGEAGLESVLLTWPSEYKGIDDFLAEDARRKKKNSRS